MADQQQQVDPSKWEEVKAVTDRPNDYPIVEPKPAVPNSTLAERAKVRAKAVSAGTTGNKAMKSDQAEDKAVDSETDAKARAAQRRRRA